MRLSKSLIGPPKFGRSIRPFDCSARIIGSNKVIGQPDTWYQVLHTYVQVCTNDMYRQVAGELVVPPYIGRPTRIVVRPNWPR